MSPTSQRRRSILKLSDRRLALAVGVSLTLGMLFGAFFLGETPPAGAAIKTVTCTNTAGDGVTTGDWKAVQDQIDTSAAGDQIVITGTCLLINTLRLADVRTYRGDTRHGTILRQADGRNLPALVATDTWFLNQDWVNTGVHIEGLTIDANSATNTGTHALVLQAWDSRVSNVEVFGAAGDGIRVSSRTQNNTALKSGQTEVNSIISDSYIHHNGGNGIFVNDPDNAVTDWVVERNWIEESGLSGIDLNNAAGWQIRDNHIYGAGENAINAHRCFNTGINDNYIEDFGGKSIATEWYYGIRCTLQADVSSAITGNRVNMFLDTGEPVPTSTLVYIGLDGVNGDTPSNGFATVTGNSAIGHGTAKEIGLGYYIGGGLSLTVVSTGNLIAQVGTQLDKDSTVVTGAGV